MVQSKKSPNINPSTLGSPDRPIVGMYQSVVCCSTYCPDLRPLQEEEWFTRAFFELSMILAVTPCMSIVSGAGIV